MSEWKQHIRQDTAVWRGIEGYVAERIAVLTGICINPYAADEEIRRAQAGIVELQVLLDLPTAIANETQARSMGTRKEY